MCTFGENPDGYICPAYSSDYTTPDPDEAVYNDPCTGCAEGCDPGEDQDPDTCACAPPEEALCEIDRPDEIGNDKWFSWTWLKDLLGIESAEGSLGENIQGRYFCWYRCGSNDYGFNCSQPVEQIPTL